MDEEVRSHPNGIPWRAVGVSLGTFLAGLILGMGLLVTQEVRLVDAFPDPADREAGAFYVLKGSTLAGSNWADEWSRMTGDSAEEMVVTEGQANAWAQAVPVGIGGDATLFTIVGDQLNFDFGEEKVQFLCRLKMPGLLKNFDAYAVVTGKLVPSQNGLKFKMTGGSLGRAPMGYDPVLGSWILKAVTAPVFKTQEGTPALFEVLRTWETAELGGDSLVLRR